MYKFTHIQNKLLYFWRCVCILMCFHEILIYNNFHHQNYWFYINNISWKNRIKMLPQKWFNSMCHYFFSLISETDRKILVSNSWESEKWKVVSSYLPTFEYHLRIKIILKQHRYLILFIQLTFQNMFYRSTIKPLELIREIVEV